MKSTQVVRNIGQDKCVGSAETEKATEKALTVLAGTCLFVCPAAVVWSFTTTQLLWHLCCVLGALLRSLHISSHSLHQFFAIKAVFHPLFMIKETRLREAELLE